MRTFRTDKKFRLKFLQLKIILRKITLHFSAESKKFSDHILQQMFARLLEVEQKEIDPNKVANWVPQEAFELRYIPNYGTFDEALVKLLLKSSSYTKSPRIGQTFSSTHLTRASPKVP